MEGVNRRIKAFRKLKGFTQLQLAKMIGVSVSILGAVERGRRGPDLILLEKISVVLKVSVDELLSKKN